MKQSLKKVMEKGGTVLLIASVAIVVYFLFIEFAGNMLKDSINEVVIVLNEDGTLSVPLEGDTSNLFIFWETDGGSVKPVKTPEEEIDNKRYNLNNQFTENNKWYTSYTHADEKVKWDSSDADGNSYQTATVRATVYSASEGEVVSYIGDNAVEKILTITVKNINNQIEKTDNRLFSNPVRSESNNDWNQIYIIENTIENKYTLAYRTGNHVPENENLVLCWITNQPILQETDLFLGGIPNFVGNEDSEKSNMVKAVNMVTCDITEEVTIEAFIVDINSSMEDDNNYLEQDKINTAAITFN